MAETKEGSIMQALFARLSTVVISPALPISWPNVSFTPPASRKYLRAQYLPNTNNRVFIGSNDPHQRIGLLQVNVHWALNAGEAAPRDIAGRVAAHFPADLIMLADGIEVRVTSAPDVIAPLIGDIDLQIPVTIPFEAWA